MVHLVLAAALCAAPPSLEARRAELKSIVADDWVWQMRERPEDATLYGDDRYGDRWADLSPAHVAVHQAEAKRLLARLEALDATGFDEPEQLDRTLLLRDLRDDLEGIALKNHELPVDQIFGVQLGLPQVMAAAPVDSVKHLEQYLARLHALPALVDQIIAELNAGIADGVVQPRVQLEKVVPECLSIADAPGEKNPFAQAAMNAPASVPAADARRLQAAIVKAVDGEVRPAYRKLAEFVRTTYAPHGRAEPGLWSLPDGPRRYRFAIHTQTTTELDPEAIHALGLKEVARILAEQEQIARRAGAKDLASYRKQIDTDPKYIPASREALLERFRNYESAMEPRLPKLFGRLPKAKLLIEPVEPFREASAAGADYEEGTPDGTRPGRVFVNTSDLSKRHLLVEATAYHEGLPGHHMQISIAQELPALPDFRRHAGYDAFVEGWALYAEGLGKELGLYTEPAEDFERSRSELLRACRLVLDTGVHAKKWSRAQMIDYAQKNDCLGPAELDAEVDRYIVAPGQALSYKLGALEIRKLRDEAQAALGAKFDLRAFHDLVLGGGALPLDVLDQRVRAWVAKQQNK